MAINSRQEIGDEAAENLHHEAIGAAGNQGIDVQVLFPPAEEFFDFPAQFINQSDVGGREVKAVGGDPELFGVRYPTTRTGRCVWLALGAPRRRGIS